MSGSIFTTISNGTVVREPRFYENEKSNTLHWTLLVDDTTGGRSRKTYIDCIAFGWLADNKRSEISAGDTLIVNGKLESFKAKDDTFKMRVVARDIVVLDGTGVVAAANDNLGEESASSDDAPF